jgi:hypothetical protein
MLDAPGTRPPMTHHLLDTLLALSPAVRYAAVRRGDELAMRQREGLRDASGAESDRYEELLVNPTLLALAGARGRIDCGGLDYIVVRYGHFFQLVHSIRDGHVSVAVAPDGDPVALVPRLRAALAAAGLWPPGGEPE